MAEIGTSKNSNNTIKHEPQVTVLFDKIVYRFQSDHNGEDCFQLGPLTFTIPEGELMAILGPSGSGKTTLLRLIAGLEYPHAGSIVIDQQTVYNNQLSMLPEKRNVGMMFQDHALFPHMTVRKNILFGIRHWNNDDRIRRLYELEDLLELRDYLDRYPHELSGGQQQRVALARTLAQKPKVILLDEPLSSIDADLRSSLAQELKNVLKQTQTTAIWVTHDQTEALDLADRIMVLREGKVEQIDTPWNLYNNPKTRFLANFIGHAVFLPGQLKGKTILTEVGTIDYLPCLQDFERLEVMIRPDDVKVVPHDAGLGQIRKRQFWGSMQLYTIDLPSSQQLLSTQPANINWPIGTKVRISLDLKSIVAFPL